MGVDRTLAFSIFRDEAAERMAFFSDLVRAVAQAEGMDEMTVTGIGQYVRDAGYITKGGRGRSAAKMTSRDAANLLIAVNGTSLAKDAPSAVEKFRALITEARSVISPNSLFGEFGIGPRDFGTALERLIEWSALDALNRSRIDISLDLETKNSIKGVDRKIVERRKIEIVRPTLEVELRRPAVSSQFRMMVPFLNYKKDRTVLSEWKNISFELDTPAEDWQHDRRDLTIITDVTLKRVAAELYS